MNRVVLIHGVATDARIWAATAAALRPYAQVCCPNRPQSGDLDTEIGFLAPLCQGALVVGVGGGATLGVELLAREVGCRGALLHEPAAGSLAPGLLDHVARGLACDGVTGFGEALYGSMWTPSDTTANLRTVTAEFAMFRAWEPPSAIHTAERTVLTVGVHSPASRHRSVRLLAAHLGAGHAPIPGTGHSAHLEHPPGFAAAILEQLCVTG